MKVCLSIVALAIIGSIEAGTISQPDNDATYFTDKLASIQGAITDTINAGIDLEVMEGKLQNIVDASSYFFRTESVTEYAVSSDAYQNGWGAQDNDDLARQLYGEGGSCETVREQGDCDGQISLGPMGNPYWDGYGKDMCPVSCEGA